MQGISCFKRGIPIAKDDTTGTLSVRLSQLGAKLLIKALEAIDVEAGLKRFLRITARQVLRLF